jgi:hypothetical protein
MAILAAAAPSAGSSGPPISLRPLSVASEPLPPYRTCQVDVDNRTGRIVQAVTVQDVRGGPTILLPITIAPNTKRSVLLPLPPTSVDQVYRVALQAGPEVTSFVLEQSEHHVAWDPEAVETALAVLIDPQAYDQRAGQTPVWPQAFRQNVLLLAGIAGLAMVGPLFIRRRRLRLAVTVAVVAAATIGSAAWLNRQPLLFARQDGPIVTVACRRTCCWWDWRGGLVPLYAVQRESTEDNATVVIPGGAIRTTMRPDVMRLFRRGH